MSPARVPGHLLAALLAVTAPLVSAQVVSPVRGFAAPVPVTQSLPPLPTNAAGNPVEGWAIVRYSVLSDGSTDNASVVAMAPPGADESATIDAIGKWTFDPATQNGEPIDWHNNETVITFRADGEAVATSPDWVGIFESIGQTIDMPVPDVDLTEALALNRSLLDEHARHPREIGLSLLQAARINLLLDDRHAAYALLRLATHPPVAALTGEELSVALLTRWRLEIQLGRTADALTTHRRIASRFPGDEDVPSAAMAEELETRWMTEEVLPVLGFVADRPWRIDASRRTFTIANVDGSIRFIDAECETTRLRLDYQADVEWSLPDTFGDCTLFVHADPGTGFTFYELLPAEG